MGTTALHLCVSTYQTHLASRILSILSTRPLDDHSLLIKDLMPDLLKLCPQAVSLYIDARLINVKWTPRFSVGNLI